MANYLIKHLLLSSLKNCPRQQCSDPVHMWTEIWLRCPRICHKADFIFVEYEHIVIPEHLKTALGFLTKLAIKHIICINIWAPLCDKAVHATLLPMIYSTMALHFLTFWGSWY